jgi:hypothetical protein
MGCVFLLLGFASATRNCYGPFGSFSLLVRRRPFAIAGACCSPVRNVGKGAAEVYWHQLHRIWPFHIRTIFHGTFRLVWKSALFNEVLWPLPEAGFGRETEADSAK